MVPRVSPYNVLGTRVPAQSDVVSPQLSSLGSTQSDRVSLRFAGEPGLDFIPAIPRKYAAWAAHSLNRVFFLRNVMMIKAFDLPDEHRDQLRDLIQDTQVFITPNHPRDMDDIICMWELMRRVTPRHKFYVQPIFLTARNAFLGAFRHIMPRLGAFSVSRSGEGVDDSKEFMHDHALTGKHPIIIYPKGESEPTNHSIMGPFKYGAANAALDAALVPLGPEEGQRKKPIVIAPLVAYYKHDHADSARVMLGKRLRIVEERLGLDEQSQSLHPRVMATRVHEALDTMITDKVEAFGLPERPEEAPLVDQLMWLQEALQAVMEERYPWLEPSSSRTVTRSHQLRSNIRKDRRRQYVERWSFANVNKDSPYAVFEEQQRQMKADVPTMWFIRNMSGFSPPAYKVYRDEAGGEKPLTHLTVDQLCGIVLKMEKALGLSGLVPVETPVVKHLPRWVRSPALAFYPKEFHPFGDLQVSYRVADPIDVSDWVLQGDVRSEYNQFASEEDRMRAAKYLTELMEERMQHTLDNVLGELYEPSDREFPNPLLLSAEQIDEVDDILPALQEGRGDGATTTLQGEQVHPRRTRRRHAWASAQIAASSQLPSGS